MIKDTKIESGKIMLCQSGEKSMQDNEDRKIQDVIEQYKDILDKSNYDVAKTAKNRWIFYELHLEHEICNAMVIFHTAEELKFLIVSNIADDLSCAVEITISDSPMLLSSIEITALNSLDDYKNMLPQLERNISVLQQTVDECLYVLKTVFHDIC
jgi:hypothetical protein